MAARQTARCLPSPADAFASLPLRARGLSVVLVPLQARMRTFLAAFRGERLASRRLRSVLFAEKRYKEVLRAKTAVVLVPLQAIMRRFKTASRGDRRLLCFLLVPNASFPPRSAANDSRLAKKAFRKMRTKSASGGDGLFTNPRIVARSQR